MKEGSEGENQIQSQAEGPQGGKERGGVKAGGEQVIPERGPTEDKVHVSKLLYIMWMQFGNCSRWG